MCHLANFTLTPHARAQRKLLFCEGCLNKMHETGFQESYETFLKVSHEHLEPESSDSVQPAKTSGAFKVESFSQTTNIIIDISDPVVDLTMLNSKQRQILARSLGLAEQSNIRKELSELKYIYKDISLLRNFDVRRYLSSKNATIKAFLDGLHSQSATAPSAYRLARAIEEMLDICGVGTVQPLHFLESLTLYCMTRSKSALQTLSARTPYPSYHTLQRWLKLLQVQQQVQHPLTSSVYAIDNNQVLQKKWGIKVENKCYSSVTTMVVAFDIHEASSILKDKENAPSSWRQFGCVSPESIRNIKYIDQDEDIKDVHYKMSLVPYVSERLAKVLKEQQLVGETWIDPIDEKIAADTRKADVKLCGACGYENVKNARKCKGCSVNLAQAAAAAQSTSSGESKTHRGDTERRVTAHAADDKLEVQTEPVEHVVRSQYTHIPVEPQQMCPKMYVLHPSMHNPNSYEAIRSVLLDVGQQAGIKKYSPTGENEVAVIFCDGVPYNLIWRLCENTYRCHDCDIILKTKKECEKHDHPNKSLEFDWVVVLPGPGHIEMNMLKSLVLLLWPVFWKDMVMLFNFTSESALRSARSVSDHHKGWAILNICRNAVVDELLVSFVRQELERFNRESRDTTSLTIKAHDYFKYLDSGRVINPNYLFMVDVAFELIDCIFLYRAGIRSGHIDMAWSARAKFAKVWTGRNHPAYRELSTNDFLQQLLMPAELRAFIDKATSINLTGTPFTGEGPDFRLEEVNRNVQGFLPLSPRSEDWERVCSNYNALRELRMLVFDMKDTSKTADIFRAKPITPAPQEEAAVRIMFRKKNYLTCPEQDARHTSISGEVLSPELVDFCKISAENHAVFVEDFILHANTILQEKPAAVKTQIKPICITQEESKECNKLENKTISELINMTETLLLEIEEVNSRTDWSELWKTVRKGRSPKSDYLMFYRELSEFVS